jgi:hypothetical protein
MSNQSIIAALNAAKNNRYGTEKDQSPSEFEGLWLNVGVITPDEEGNDKFLRLPRGVAISDLKTRKIYESMDAGFAAETRLINTVIEEIQNKACELEEGESIPINLSLVLYRKQEEANVKADPKLNKTIHETLFG